MRTTNNAGLKYLQIEKVIMTELESFQRLYEDTELFRANPLSFTNNSTQFPFNLPCCFLTASLKQLNPNLGVVHPLSIRIITQTSLS